MSNRRIQICLLSLIYLTLTLSAVRIYAQSSYDNNSRQAYTFSRTASQPKIAIIIDDIGYNIPLGQRTVELEGDITLAVLPETPGS